VWAITLGDLKLTTFAGIAAAVHCLTTLPLQRLLFPLGCILCKNKSANLK